MAGKAPPCPRVHNERPVRPGDDRVEVELGDLGQVVGEPRHAQQQVAQRLEARGGLPRWRSSGAERIEPMSLSASVSVSGVSRAAWSASTSVATPPSPNTTSGPNMWSSATPTITSVPPVIIGWTRTWRSRPPKRSSSL